MFCVMVLKKLSRAIQDPYLIRSRIQYELFKFKATIPHDIGIQGSYNSGNVGDRSIGELLKQHAKEGGYRTYLFDKNIDDSNARIHVLACGGVIHDWYGIDHLNSRLEYVSDGGLLLGVGVPGLRRERARRIVREKLQTVDTVTVRDRQSKRRLRTAYDGEIEVTACPAILYDDPKKDSTGRTGVNFVPCFDKSADVLSYYFGYDEDICVEGAMDAYVENAQLLVDKLENPILSPFIVTM